MTRHVLMKISSGIMANSIDFGPRSLRTTGWHRRLFSFLSFLPFLEFFILFLHELVLPIRVLHWNLPCSDGWRGVPVSECTEDSRYIPRSSIQYSPSFSANTSAMFMSPSITVGCFPIFLSFFLSIFVYFNFQTFLFALWSCLFLLHAFSCGGGDQAPSYLPR